MTENPPDEDQPEMATGPLDIRVDGNKDGTMEISFDKPLSKLTLNKAGAAQFAMTICAILGRMLEEDQTRIVLPGKEN